MMDMTHLESTGDCPVIIDLRKENAMSEPTREQLIQQANLRADYNEAWERGKHWEDWQCRPWNSPNDWRETKCVPFSNAIGYEYRRTPEPPKPIEGWVIMLTENDPGDTLYHSEAEANGVSLCHSSLHDKRVVHLREVDPDTVTVPKAVVEEIIRWWKHDVKLGTHGPAAEAIGTLIDAVKGGAE
jgi:hypothetical protein